MSDSAPTPTLVERCRDEAQMRWEDMGACEAYECLTLAADRIEQLERELSAQSQAREKAERERNMLRLLEGMDALEVSTLATYIRDGDIPETIERARVALVERMLKAERARDEAQAVIAQHDLCHNLHGKVDAIAFAEGCAAEQRKLYGCAPHADRLSTLRELVRTSDEVEALLELNAAEHDDNWEIDIDQAQKAHAAADAAARLALSGKAQEQAKGALDTDRRVCFYERDFYVLSNFSAFRLRWGGINFDTSEHAYHWMKFCHTRPDVAELVRDAPSAHEAFKCAEEWRDVRLPDWDAVKVGFMRDILRAKANQHEYVLRKLLATGDRELVEDSWRDDFWGWGPNRDGQNMLGKLWMEIRTELRTALSAIEGATEGEGRWTT